MVGEIIIERTIVLEGEEATIGEEILEGERSGDGVASGVRPPDREAVTVGEETGIDGLVRIIELMIPGEGGGEEQGRTGIKSLLESQLPTEHGAKGVRSLRREVQRRDGAGFGEAINTQVIIGKSQERPMRPGRSVFKGEETSELGGESSAVTGSIAGSSRQPVRVKGKPFGPEVMERESQMSL